MVCNAIFSNFALRVGNLRACRARSEGQFRGLWRDLEPSLNARFSQRRRGLGARTVRMMVEPGSAGEAGAAAVNKSSERGRAEDGGLSTAIGKSPEKDRAEDGRLSAPIGKSHEKDQAEDGGYVSGGWKSEDGKVSWGYSSFRGKRATMEDYYDVKSFNIDGQRICLFGMFDGHGGARAAEYLKNHLFENLSKHPKFLSDTKLAISETFKKTDVDFLAAESNTFRDDGSTASTAVLVGNHLYVGNVGDSRAVVSKAGKAIPLSDDHKPNRSDERQRIEKAGGVVMWAGTWRVGGVLAMSRAFGNRMLKPFVVAEPEIQEREITDELELLVLASDGLWDVVPNEDAVSLARVEEEPEAAARKLTETAFSRGSADNITCIVVKFHHENDMPGNSPPESPQH